MNDTNWTVGRESRHPSPNFGDIVILGEDGFGVARVLPEPPIYDRGSYSNLEISAAIERRDARARLIAAAPELLEALQDLIDDMRDSGCLNHYSRESCCGVSGAVENARAANARATGKESQP